MRFLTPSAGLIALAGLMPLALLLLVEWRARRARAVLRLPAPGVISRLELPVALCALATLLGLAAAQPVLSKTKPYLVRRDAEAFIAIDISRSMLASRSRTSPSRLDRAKVIADRMRAALEDIPVGVLTFTDRALPLLFPSPAPEAFASTVAKAVGVEHPPPRGTALTVTSFDAVAQIPVAGYFRPGATHRLLVVVTDAESEEFDVDMLRWNFAKRPRVDVVLVRVGSASEQVFGPDGLPESAYIPPPASGQALASFLAATHGRTFGEHNLAGAERAARVALGSGPRERLGTVSGRRDLAPILVLASALPLALVLRRRNL